MHDSCVQQNKHNVSCRFPYPVPLLFVHPWGHSTVWVINQRVDAYLKCQLVKRFMMSRGGCIEIAQDIEMEMGIESSGRREEVNGRRSDVRRRYSRQKLRPIFFVRTLSQWKFNQTTFRKLITLTTKQVGKLGNRVHTVVDFTKEPEKQNSAAGYNGS